MQDEVDDLVAAWHGVRPDLVLHPVHVWSRIHRLALHLDDARRRCFSQLSVEVWEFDVLAALRKSGPPYQLAPGQLIRETHVTSGTMTNRIDRLTQRGLVIRHSNPEDRRGVLVELTDAGIELADTAFSRLLAIEAQLLAEIDSESQQQLIDALRTLLVAQNED
ncbi:MAG: MarR family transcriptional regulator [Propionibacterium sp.]|nr:MAG: MarR family transcriptional regulator [Propionibacterium sp.]